MRGGNFIERSLKGAAAFLQGAVFSEEYAAKKGFLQARDPRAKLAGILFFLLAVLFSRSLYFLAGIYAICLALAGCSSISLGFFLKRTLVFIPLFSLFTVLPALFNIVTPGEPAVSFKIFTFSLSVTRQGIAGAAFLLMRVLTSVSLCAVLVLTTRQDVSLKVLRVLGIPQVFVMTLGMCRRYVYLFMEVIQHAYLAIKSRVGRVSSVKNGQGIAAWNIAGLWQRSYQLNEEVYKAMLSRGYRGEPVVWYNFKMGVIDWVWLVMAILIFYGSFR